MVMKKGRRTFPLVFVVILIYFNESITDLKASG
jgi:hypothetical protein